MNTRHHSAIQRPGRSAFLSRRAAGRRVLLLVLAFAVIAGLAWSGRPLAGQVADEGPQGEPAAAVGANAGAPPAAGPAEADSAQQPEPRSSIPVTPAEVMEALGWYFAVPFLLASVIALWFGMERLVVLRQGRVIPRPFVERFLQHLEQGKLDPETALGLCHQNGSPVAQVFAHGVRKWGKPSVEVEQAIIDGGERQVSQLRNHLRILNGVASVAPLIGLFGTVVGMIMSFNDIATSDAMGKANELAGGIAVALLTTAVGLAIAIPSLILYMYLSGRVDSLVMEMDELAQNVVHLISAESLARDPVAAAKPSTGHRVPSKPHAGPPQKKAV
jgi:biopolymer transport protein ExbB